MVDAHALLRRAFTGEAPLPLADRATLLAMLVEDGLTVEGYGRLSLQAAVALVAGIGAEEAARALAKAVEQGDLIQDDEGLVPSRPDLFHDSRAEQARRVVGDLVQSINRLIAARQSAPWEAGTPEHAEWVAAEVEARARVAAAGGCAAPKATDAGEHDHLCPCERFAVEVVPGAEVSDG